MSMLINQSSRKRWKHRTTIRVNLTPTKSEPIDRRTLKMSVSTSTFCFPLPQRLSNDLVELIPFSFEKHAEIYVAAFKDHPETFKWLPYGPLVTASLLEQFLQNRIYPSSAETLFSIKDKTRNSGVDDAGEGELTTETFAGVIAYINASYTNACLEIGHVLVAPPCQRTHVLTNAVGLLLQYAFDLPLPADTDVGRGEGGLGLRRVQWLANTANAPSIRAAERLGFTFEGVMRWHRVLPAGKVGPRTRDDGRGEGRDTAVLAICWDDWEGGVREAIKQKMVLRKK